MDICKRNKIAKLNFTGDKSGNLTMHKYFQATACPGEYLASKFPYIASEVNKRLAPAPTPAPVKQDYISYTVQKGGSWWQIAQDKLGNGNRYMELVRFNGHTTAPSIYPGNIIKIPCGTATATVKVPAKASAPKPAVKPVAPKKTIEQVAKEVIQGKWGNGLIRRLKLKKAGYNYSAIQAEVNKYYK